MWAQETTTMTKFTLVLTFGAALCGTSYGSPVGPAGAIVSAAAVAAAELKPDAEKVEAAAVELAKRAEAGDRAFIAQRMEKDVSGEAVGDMIARLRRADVRKTFREHLEGRGPDGAGLNYHEPSHVQVELRKGQAGKWEVARLWFCR
jgi:hypothetical protein